MTQPTDDIPLRFSVPSPPHHPGSSPRPALTIAGDQEIRGVSPVVLIGANGAGKSRFAALLANQPDFTFIAADRSVDVPQALALTPVESAARDLRDNQYGHAIGMPGASRSRRAADIGLLFTYLKADETQAATEFRRAALTGTPVLAPTKLDDVERLWKVIFPDRRFDLSSHETIIVRNEGADDEVRYSANELSDGEKSILYLIARLVTAEPGIVVVDEPETHIHALLARRFWDTVEDHRPDCRFVYVTHDLQFAQSRTDARMVIVRSATEAVVIPENETIPEDIFEEIYGAATLAVSTTRIVLCEGVDDGSVDRPYYEAWFSDPTTEVVPVGSCSAVRQAAATLGRHVVSEAVPLGIVERDFWPEDWLGKRAMEGLHVLPVHELEGLFCLKEVAQAIAAHLGLTDFDTRWAQAETEARRTALVVKVIIERAKRRIDIALEGLANPAATALDRATARAGLIAAVDVSRPVPDIGAIFDEEAIVVDQAMAGSWEDFLKVMPNKPALGQIARAFGVNNRTYTGLIVAALKDPDTHPSLARALEAAYVGILPARSSA